MPLRELFPAVVAFHSSRFRFEKNQPQKFAALLSNEAATQLSQVTSLAADNRRLTGWKSEFLASCNRLDCGDLLLLENLFDAAQSARRWPERLQIYRIRKR